MAHGEADGRRRPARGLGDAFGSGPGARHPSRDVTITGAGTVAEVAVTLTVAEAPGCTSPAGLVGAWGFDEVAGPTVTDTSSLANDGVITQAVRSPLGRYGGALRFDGANDMVTVPDANSLDLRAGMTLSTWVNPTTVAGSWRTVLLKERGTAISYALYANTDSAQAGGYIATPSEVSAKSTAAVPVGVWTHLAATYDGATLRVYFNGVQVSSHAVSASVAIGTGALRIGGNSIWPEWFAA